MKELSRVRASPMGISVVWGASSCSGGPGRGGGGIDMLEGLLIVDLVPTTSGISTWLSYPIQVKNKKIRWALARLLRCPVLRTLHEKTKVALVKRLAETGSLRPHIVHPPF